MVIKVINRILVFLMLLFGIIFIFIDYKYKFFFIFFFISFFVALIFSYLLQRMNINENYNLLISISLWLNLFGDLGLYAYFQYYDKILHAIIPILITAILYSYYKKNFANKSLIFFSVMGILASFEIYEYIVQTIFNFQMMGVISGGEMVLSYIDDTMIDLILGGLSSIGYLFSLKFVEKEPVKKDLDF